MLKFSNFMGKTSRKGDIFTWYLEVGMYERDNEHVLFNLQFA